MRRRTFLASAGAVLLPVRAEPPADFYFTRLKYASGDWNAIPMAGATVLQALARHTNLHTDPRERVAALGDARMLESPFCYLAGTGLAQFNSAERANFERYVRGGGFVYADDAGAEPGGLFARSFEAELARSFGPKALRRLAPGHPLFSCYFQFDAAPESAAPAGAIDDGAVRGELRAIDIGGRIRVLYSNKHYSGARATVETRRFAVNIIEYALGA